MKTEVVFDQETLPFCCGIADVGRFEFETWTDDEWEEYIECEGCSPQEEVQRDGTGLFTASFVNDNDCKEAYKYLCANHKLLYQSKPYYNENSGRKLFLCVFLHKDIKK